MKILYLYPDLMNLYGESGNLCALERRLADQGEDVSVDRKAPGEALEIAAYDWIYMGAGTERSQKAALEHLRPCAGALREAMDAGKHALFTGNAAALLGREITDAAGQVWQGWGCWTLPCGSGAIRATPATPSPATRSWSAPWWDFSTTVRTGRGTWSPCSRWSWAGETGKGTAGRASGKTTFWAPT